MFLSSKWWANSPGSSPFRDNADGAITAATLRQFAYEVATTGEAVEWFKYSPGPANLGDPYVWTDIGPEVWWMQDSGTGKKTDGWSYMSNSEGQMLFSAGSSDPGVVIVQMFGSVDPTGYTPDTVIRPVLWAGGVSPDTAGAILIGASHPITPGSTDITGSTSILLDNVGGVFLSVGLMFVPPSGTSVQSSGGSFYLDVLEMETTVTVMPAAPSSPIV